MPVQEITLAAARAIIPTPEYGKSYLLEWGTWRLLATGDAIPAAREAAKAAGMKTATFRVVGRVEG